MLMTIAFQLALFTLIATLFLLVVGIPVAFAFPSGVGPAIKILSF